MSFPLILLGLGAIFVGYLGRDGIIGVGTEFFSPGKDGSSLTATT